MKIAYLLDWDIINSSGVLQKIARTVSFWEGKGVEVHLLIVSYGTIQEFVPSLPHVRVFDRPELKLLVLSSIKTFIGRNRAFGKVYSYLRSFAPDIIYYRPGTMWYPNISKCLTTAPTILEINSIDENEAKLFYRQSGIQYKLFYSGRRRIVGQSAGIIALTNEIAESLSFSKKPVEVIANGIDFKPGGFHKSTRIYFDPRPQVVFVGSPGQIWQGFDLFVTMAERMPEADFHLVGPSSLDAPSPSNLKIYGYLRGPELNELYQKMDIGVGTLALHRKEMKEACPLKVREYIVYGLPVILGYKDTDLDGQDFVLNIGCGNDNVITFRGQIREFIFKWQKRAVPIEIGERLIGIEPKELSRLRFMEGIL